MGAGIDDIPVVRVVTSDAREQVAHWVAGTINAGGGQVRDLRVRVTAPSAAAGLIERAP